MSDEARQESALIGNGRDVSGRFVPGNPGGPGRPKGSRDALTFRYLGALLNEFERRARDNKDENGPVAALDNEALCNMIGKAIAKETNIEVGENFTDLLRRADELLAQRRT